MSTKRNPTNAFLRGVSDTVHKRAKAWDGILGGNDMEVSVERAIESPYRKSVAFSNLDHRKINFDGRTQLHGTNDETETKHKIASCREAYENVGIIGNIVDIMIDFALEELEIEHEKPEVERFFKKWKRTAKVFEVSEMILKGLYRDGNVPILSFFGELNSAEIVRMRRFMANKDAKAKAQILDPETVVKNVIPFRYEMLDAIRMFRTGSELLGTIGWEYQFDADDLGFRGVRTASIMKEQRDAAVKTFREQVGLDDKSQLTQTMRIVLPEARMKMLYYKRDGYRSWATPMLWRVIPDVKFKKLIRDMDISVAEGVTNALTIIKLGAVEQGIPPSKKKFQKITAMLRTPQKSKTIVWDNLISIETAFPPVEKFFSDKKYKQADADIRAGLGIPEALVNGQGTNFSNSFLAIKTLMERLETGRKVIQSFWTDQVNIVTRNMGFRKSPIVRMGKMSLTDEEVEKRFMIELFDRNAISFETLLNRFGEDVRIEIERIRREDKQRTQLEDTSDYALLRVGKFSANVTQFLNPEEEQEVKQSPQQQGGEGPKGGRPPGTKKKQKQQTQPDAPQGQKTAAKRIVVVGPSVEEINLGFDKLYKIVATSIAKGKKYQSLRELSDGDRVKLAHSIARALPKLIDHTRWTKALVKEALGSGGEKPSRVEAITRATVKKFRETHNNAPDKKTLRTITIKAFDASAED